MNDGRHLGRPELLGHMMVKLQLAGQLLACDPDGTPIVLRITAENSACTIAFREQAHLYAFYERLDIEVASVAEITDPRGFIADMLEHGREILCNAEFTDEGMIYMKYVCEEDGQLDTGRN